jgi:predicted esterase
MDLPTTPGKSDFPDILTLDIVPSGKPPVNVLVLMHGLGDTQVSFAQLGRNLNLPETVCLSVQGPTPIPPFFTGSETPAFSWGDDILVDERSGEIDVEGGGFQKSVRVLKMIVDEVLVGRLGWKKRNILFLGFGQGGIAALYFAASLPQIEELGGVISIGGKLPSASLISGKGSTPVLVLGGSRSTQLTRSAIDGLKEKFRDVEYVKWEKNDDSMPRNREEMLPIMKFLARRLGSRAGVPGDAIEV